MDIVYPVRAGKYQAELRYSLRSLGNLPHDRVFLVGHVPEWATGIVGIPREQSAGRWRNVQDNLLAALEVASDPFLLMNDDFYIMSPMPEVPIYHQGPMAEVIDRYRRTRHTGAYWRGMVATYYLLQEWGYSNPLGYELHIPLLIHHAPMLRALSIGQELEVLAYRSLYGNLAELGGIQHEDCKVLYRAGVLEWQQYPFLSSNDDVAYSPLGKHLAATFPEAGRYES